MNNRTKRIAASALVALLALSLSPTPIAPVAAQDEPPVECKGYYRGPESLTIPGTGIDVPLGDPCGGFNDAVAPTGKLWAGLQLDENEDGMGDEWQAAMGAFDLVASNDADTDGLTNIQEFYWLSNPLVADSDLGGGDGWTDGAEAKYWSSTNKGGTLNVGGTKYAYPGPFAFYDTDGDGLPNILDADSDDDGLQDGAEVHDHETKPERADTDGDGLIDGGITPLLSERVIGEVHDVGSDPTLPDSDADGIRDRDEYEHWTQVRGYAGTKTLDTDGDGIINIRDPDSDGDGARDGQELQFNTRADRPDTDGDKLPDGWEIAFNQPATTSSATQDSDRDGATALEEYCYGITLSTCRSWDYYAEQDYHRGGTIPNDADTDDDFVLDGEEMDRGTDPLHWDTDRDGMPDEYEIQYGFNPLDAADAALDADSDFFDQNQDGTPEQVHTNLAEYQYGRPANHDEASQGPWQLGTIPLDVDTDDDGANDAQEMFFGTDPRVPADLASDDDMDGLNWTAEARLGTDPNDADTDGDGLCDGGRAPACTFPNLAGVGHPGERDYGSSPWATDTDDDGIMDGVEATIWDPEASGTDADVDGDLVGGITDADNDGDDLEDGDEAGYGGRMDVPDSDGDGLLDGAEVFLYGTPADTADSDDDRLTDGAEILVHGTDPLDPDTDGDEYWDGAEVLLWETNPLSVDTDGDGLPDGWEIFEGTQPKVDDAGADPDGDGLNNLVEYQYGSSPIQTDTDFDGLPDGWEYEYDLDPRASSASLDSDLDGSLNVYEFRVGTNPRDVDTDDDGLWDGDEARKSTLPLVVDTDADGILDGEEVHTYGTKPLERDSDRDGLSDYDEVFTTKTDPLDRDTDNDGLSDYDEVFTYQGLYDPNNSDTDGDGRSDGAEVALSDPNGDFDRDGLTNSQEDSTYGTDPEEADSDCDGISDGAEVAFWQTRYSLTAYKPFLWNADVDGDGIKDGVEVGSAGTPQQALYRTRPDVVDSDGDLLADNDEAVNNVKVSCGQTQTTMSSALPEPVPGVSLNSALRDAAGLVPGVLYEAPDGVMFGVDEEGVYIQGGYGVRLYPLDVEVDLSAPLVPFFATTASAGTNGELTDPQEWDTDGDGISDGDEIQVHGTNPIDCDTDDDLLGDGLEVGVPGRTLRVQDPCTHRDADPSSTTDPRVRDTDDDGLLDGWLQADNGRRLGEDLNANGRVDLLMDPFGYCGRTSSETGPRDMDSDDDGVPDEVDDDPTCFDADGDGLSDGLELGLKSTARTPDTLLRSVSLNGFSIPTWQPSATGLVLNPGVADMDGDGVIDGLEDLDRDGRWGSADTSTLVSGGELHPNNPDTDGDRIPDGRELLLWGTTGCYIPIQCVMEAWEGDVTRIQHDPASLFRTDPLDANTDNDDANDGYDLNPLDDALLAIDFGTFYLRERPDKKCGGWWCGGSDDGWTAEIYARLGITLPTGTGNYLVSMSEDEWIPVWTKQARHLPGTLMDALVDDSNLGAVPTGVFGSPMWRLAGAGGTVLLVDIPDNGVKLDKVNQEISVDLLLRDKDVSDNDDIDLDPKTGSSPLRHKIPLGRPLSGDISSDYPHLVVEEVYRDHYAKNKEAMNNKNGHLKLRMGDNVHEFFLRTVNDVLTLGNARLPDSGKCFAADSCV